MSAHEKMLEAHSSKTLRIHTDSLREALGGVITPQSTLIIHRYENGNIKICIDGHILGESCLNRPSPITSLNDTCRMLSRVKEFFNTYPDEGFHHQWHFEKGEFRIHASTIHRAMLKALVIERGGYDLLDHLLGEKLSKHMTHIRTPTLYRDDVAMECAIHEVLRKPT